MPTHDRTIDELLAYLSAYPGPRPTRHLLDDAFHAYVSGLLTDGEYESVLAHHAAVMRIRFEGPAAPSTEGEAADPDMNRDVGGEG